MTIYYAFMRKFDENGVKKTKPDISKLHLTIQKIIIEICV